jgi:putative ABC transport system permease protein
MQGIALLMVVLGVTNGINMAIFERTREFGTMRALGTPGREVRRMVLLEAAILGFASATLGELLGILFAAAISAIGIPMPPPPNSDTGYTAQIRIVPTVLAGAFAVGVVGAIVAAIAPGRRVARMPIADALRHT